MTEESNYFKYMGASLLGTDSYKSRGREYRPRMYLYTGELRVQCIVAFCLKGNAGGHEVYQRTGSAHCTGGKFILFCNITQA